MGTFTRTQARPTRRRAPHEKCARIQAAARELFASQGYDETPTAQVAQHAGVSEGILFHHFGTKRDLFLRLAEKYGRECAAAIMPADPAQMTIESVVRSAFAFAERAPGLYRLFSTAGPRLGAFDATPMSDAIVSVVEQHIASDMEQGIARSGNARIMAELQFAVVERAYGAWKKSGEPARQEEFIAEAIRCMETMLTPGAESTTGPAPSI
jgi:AcrR family transcriptional regulator